MQVCEWLYETPSGPIKVELIAYLHSKETDAGGLDLDVIFDMSVLSPAEAEESGWQSSGDAWAKRAGFKLADSLEIRGELANGVDPLWAMCFKNPRFLGDVIRQCPPLGAYFQAEILKISTPPSGKQAGAPPRGI